MAGTWHGLVKLVCRAEIPSLLVLVSPTCLSASGSGWISVQLTGSPLVSWADNFCRFGAFRESSFSLFLSFFFSLSLLAIPQFGLLSHSLGCPQDIQGPVLTLSSAGLHLHNHPLLAGDRHECLAYFSTGSCGQAHNLWGVVVVFLLPPSWHFSSDIQRQSHRPHLVRRSFCCL